AERRTEEDPLRDDHCRRQYHLQRRRPRRARLVDAAELLAEYRARLDTQARAPQFAAGENPCLELMTLLLAAPRQLWPTLDFEERRRELSSLFSWGVPNERSL